MKEFLKSDFLNVLWVLTLAVLFGSVIFTIATGDSPLEALGVSPAVATIGTIMLMLALIVGHGIADAIRRP